MGYDDRSNSASGLAVLLLLALLLVGLTAGGVLFYRYRLTQAMVAAERQKRLAEQAAMHAMEAANQARLAEQQAARLPVAKAAAPLQLDTDSTSPANPSMVVLEIDAQGQVRSEAELLEATQLETWLEQQAPAQITIRVDPRCPFAHVLRVQEACQAAGIRSLSLKALGPKHSPAAPE